MAELRVDLEGALLVLEVQAMKKQKLLEAYAAVTKIIYRVEPLAAARSLVLQILADRHGWGPVLHRAPQIVAILDRNTFEPRVGRRSFLGFSAGRDS